MNPIRLAIIVSVLLGVAMVPWNYALKQMASSQFLMMLGVAFLVASEVVRRIDEQPFTFSYVALGLAVAAIVPYVVAVCAVNPIYKRTPPEMLPVVAAILAAFALPALFVNAFVSRTLPSMAEMVFIAVTIIGVAGLSLFGRH